MSKFYVYQLRLDGSPLPFYIGKGSGNRVIQHFRPSSLKAKTIKNHIINRAIREGVEVLVEKVATNLTEQDSFETEIKLIAHFGRKDKGTGILANMTDGGEGGSGYIPTNEKRQAVSKALTGKIVSAETGRKISEAKKGIPGKPRTAQDKANISAKMRGVPKSPETVERMKAAWELRRQKSKLLPQ